MIYEITTTSGNLIIVHGKDRIVLQLANISILVKSYPRISLGAHIKNDPIFILWTDGVTLNGVTQTDFNSFASAIEALINAPNYSLSFSNTDLVANVLTVNHNLNVAHATTHIFNNLGAEVTGQYTPTLVTANQETIDFGGAITGTWFLIVTKIN